MTDSTASFEIEESTRHHWVATSGDLVVVIAYEGSEDDPRHIIVATRAFEKLHKRLGHPVKLLFILPHERGKPPSQEVRDAFKDALRRHEASAARAAFVVRGSGFSAAVHRSVIAGALVLMRGRRPYRVTSTIREGLEYLLGPESEQLPVLLDECERRRVPST